MIVFFNEVHNTKSPSASTILNYNKRVQNPVTIGMELCNKNKVFDRSDNLISFLSIFFL